MISSHIFGWFVGATACTTRCVVFSRCTLPGGCVRFVVAVFVVVVGDGGGGGVGVGCWGSGGCRCC